jgi:hypothetical protein
MNTWQKQDPGGHKGDPGPGLRSRGRCCAGKATNEVQAPITSSCHLHSCSHMRELCIQLGAVKYLYPTLYMLSHH